MYVCWYIKYYTLVKTKYFISCWRLWKFMIFTYSFFWSIAQAASTDEEIVRIFAWIFATNFVLNYSNLFYKTKVILIIRFWFTLDAYSIYWNILISIYTKGFNISAIYNGMDQLIAKIWKIFEIFMIVLY